MRTPPDDPTPDGIWLTPGAEALPLDPRDDWATASWDADPGDFDVEGHSRWAEKWAPPCPDGHPQRLACALGFRERSIGELELRVALGGSDNGVCQVVVDERDDEVHVRLLVCYDERRVERASRRSEYVDCPVRVWLDRPLGDRAVVDHDSDEELLLFTPAYRNNVPQPEAGYRPANRRDPWSSSSAEPAA